MSATGVAVVGLLAVLLLEINSSPAADVPEDELARARAAHARLQSGGGGSGSAVNSLDIDPSDRPEVRARDQEEPAGDEADEEEPERDAPRVRRGRSVVATPSTRPRIRVDRDDDENPLEARMDDVNGFYDKANYLDAHEAALDVLDEHPRNVRMLRVAVSTSCILGEASTAQRLYRRMPSKDQRDMAVRCKKYGVEF